MKKWMYVIFPGAMLAIFLVFYFSSEKRWEAQEAEQARQAAIQKAADERHKADLEQQAREAARKRAEEQKAEDAAKEKARNDKWNAESRAIQEATDKANAEATRYNKEVSELEIELDALHRRKENLTRSDFDLLKQVELARVKEQDAELQIQRMVSAIAERAKESTLVQAPPAPAPEK